MPKIHIDVPGVTFAGEAVPVGTIVDVTDLGYTALVAEGKGSPVDEQNRPVDAPPASGDQTPDKDAEAAAAAQIEREKKALADQYTLEESSTKPGLKEAALAAGVDFPYDVTKGDLIDLIVAQGKAAELIN